MNDLAPLSACDISARCREYALSPRTENMTAVVLLLAAQFIDRLAERTERLAYRNEQLEARQQ